MNNSALVGRGRVLTEEICSCDLAFIQMIRIARRIVAAPSPDQRSELWARVSAYEVQTMEEMGE